MCRRPASGLALMITVGALFALGGGVARADRADRAVACAELTLDSLDASSELLSFELDLPLELPLEFQACSLFDGGACEEAGASLGPSPHAPALAARCEGAYGLALLRVRAPRGNRLTASWPDPAPPARALASAMDRGSLAPAPPPIDPATRIPTPVHGVSTVSTPRRGSPDVVTPPSLVLVPLAAGHARGLERPPRA